MHYSMLETYINRLLRFIRIEAPPPPQHKKPLEMYNEAIDIIVDKSCRRKGNTPKMQWTACHL